jgi:sulfur-oxidizing protein SoxZ
MTRALINVPPKAKRGEVIEIKTLISHEMEPGYRADSTGVLKPRDIITDFVCKYNGEEIFRAELFPAIAANPFFVFSTVATEAASSRSSGPATTAFPRPSPLTSPSNETRAGGRRLCRPARQRRRRRRNSLSERKSGYDLMGPQTRAMQDDDTANPGMFWVLDGEALWKRKSGAAENPAPTAMATPKAA